MRIAFFGGSFDPPHLGHLAIAQAAADRLQLDRVLVAPVGSQPLKKGLSLATYDDRLAMVQLGFSADARCEASRLDAPRADGGHNYTFETLSALKAALHAETADAHLFCLLGADSFHTLAHWHRAAELLLLCDFVVAARPGYALDQVASQLPPGIRLCEEEDEGDWQRPSQSESQTVALRLEGTGDLQGAASLFVLRDLKEDVSATTLRQALALGDCEASDRMLTPGVATFIREHRLYQSRCVEG